MHKNNFFCQNICTYVNFCLPLQPNSYILIKNNSAVLNPNKCTFVKIFAYRQFSEG